MPVGGAPREPAAVAVAVGANRDLGSSGEDVSRPSWSEALIKLKEEIHRRSQEFAEQMERLEAAKRLGRVVSTGADLQRFAQLAQAHRELTHSRLRASVGPTPLTLHPPCRWKSKPGTIRPQQRRTAAAKTLQVTDAANADSCPQTPAAIRRRAPTSAP
eukprot:TRINITY_DN8494_c0_g1_i1.p1 TRINITY_DN8494_c0_g1~~TRINITY_DN8494_c0_g1_i1.p1  ORF type:complete len:175 (+),score=37.69 TRINITY_DN8494_c0_g1_i1:51-527(+)